MVQQHEQLKMELLAPAGDWSALHAALAGGADAVYLGGKLFNARQSAANFERDQLKEAIDLLHLHHRKIYVTVNTLLRQDELKSALEYIIDLYNLGVDAIIVQDLGLICLARRYIPQLKLHASTQMTVHNSEGALLLKEMGIQRVVLAREMTAEEIQSIIERTEMDVEVFVHGALCVCYSGQCLMSSIIGGRSGNRGRCAQPCRLEYHLIKDGQTVPAEGLHLLSPKDLALLPVIPELDRIGVRSLKIEGRMKRPEYVYTVTKTYRRALDYFYQNPSNYQVDPQWLKSLEQTFNRGFSTGYFGGVRNRSLMSFTRPNNRGIYVGRVKKIQQNKISVRLETDLEIGDQVEIWVSRGGRATASLGSLFSQGRKVTAAAPGEEVTFDITGKVYPGDRIFKVYSSKVARETEAAIDNANPEFKIPCSLEVYGRLNLPLTIIYRDNDGNEGKSSSEIGLQPAKNRPLTEEVIREQLGRLGTSPFYLKEMTMDLEPDLMLPLSILNQLRRSAIDALERKRLSVYERPNVSERLPAELCYDRRSVPEKILSSPRLSVWVGDLESARAVAETGADIIYGGGDELNGFHWDTSAFTEAATMAHDSGARFIAGLPRINREEHRLSWTKYLENALKAPVDGIMVSDLGAWKILLTTPDIPVYLNYPLNFFNRCAFQFIESPQIKQWTVSPELTLAQITELSRKAPDRLECLVHGPLELMVSEYCPIGSVEGANGSCGKKCRVSSYTLCDRLKMNFPIFTDQFCRMHLLNSKDLCLLGDLDKFSKLPLILRLELKTYHGPDAALLTRAYRTALRDGLNPAESERLIEKFKTLSGRGITKGHFFRGVE